MRSLFKWYTGKSILLRIVAAVLIGSGVGCVLWYVSIATGNPVAAKAMPWISPFGMVLVNMLKMIVIPVIFFSLILGAASLPISRFGAIGLKVIGWYLFCSFLAAGVGVFLALVINPGSGGAIEGWEEIARSLGGAAEGIVDEAQSGRTFVDMLVGMFQNPFQSLSSGNFLAIIVFSVLFGLSIRIIMEKTSEPRRLAQMETVVDFLSGVRDAIFKMVDWILEYAPIGVLALSIVNFGVYGPNIVGPYVSVTLGVICGILCMMLVVYPTLLVLVTKQNPFRIMREMEQAILTAFITRSSAATLPVTLRTVEERLKVKNELASFSLPLGATINMDGVCVHLPMFAVLAANMFGIHLGAGQLVMLVITTVLASIGAGGVPGGSLMLLFIILGNMGLDGAQTAVIVALALGINPILDMFETANNVTGDMVCTYAVAKQEGLIEVA
ncbi:MAG: dicarboxylate/amino acid:cation symporter [Candidatus Latescibacterota bacterium]|jgi:Na+/H+-dicarboxylate symporter|nr:MAG: dicarboxylate/amino acid:cation symporter [Candidatus Latescibacterota bacterium]